MVGAASSIDVFIVIASNKHVEKFVVIPKLMINCDLEVRYYRYQPQPEGLPTRQVWLSLFKFNFKLHLKKKPPVVLVDYNRNV